MRGRFSNTFGYFIFDYNDEILEQITIFDNASKLNGGGTLLNGDTVNVGQFPAGANIGFWLEAGG